MIYLFVSCHDRMYTIRYRSHPGPYLYSYLGVVFCVFLLLGLIFMVLLFWFDGLYFLHCNSMGCDFFLFLFLLFVLPAVRYAFFTAALVGQSAPLLLCLRGLRYLLVTIVVLLSGFS